MAAWKGKEQLSTPPPPPPQDGGRIRTKKQFKCVGTCYVRLCVKKNLCAA